MRSLLRFVLLVACLSSGRPAWAADEQKPSSDEARAAALAWLKLVDEGKYADSWKEAAEYFKVALTEQAWVTALNKARQPLGSVDKREAKSADFTHDLPRAPKGDYWVFVFATTFDGTDTLETVTPMLGKDGKWRVSGYFIKPTA